MDTYSTESHDFPTLQTKLVGDQIDHYGANIHQLGRILLASQELVNVAASYKIRQDLSIDDYSIEIERGFLPRVFYLQGHLSTVRRGSLDLIVQVLAQPELRAALMNENVHAFGISVLANLVTTAGFVLSGRWREMKKSPPEAQQPDQGLAVQLAPTLERLARTVTPRGGIGHIEMIAEDTNGARVELRVDRASRENVLTYADMAPAKEIELVGEIRSIDLDRQTATILHAATGERMELDIFEEPEKISHLLRKMVHIIGSVRPSVNRRGGVKSRIEVRSIKLLTELMR